MGEVGGVPGIGDMSNFFNNVFVDPMFYKKNVVNLHLREKT